MADSLEAILVSYGYDVVGRCRGSSGRCWLLGTRRGRARDHGDKEVQVMAALAKVRGNTDEKHFVFSVSRTALATKWVQEQVQNPDEFLQRAGMSRFCELLRENDEGPDDYPEVLLNSRTDPAEFRLPSGVELSSEIQRVRTAILDALRSAAYAGDGRISKEAVAERVCTRNSVLDRSLIYLEERGYIKGALSGKMKISTAGEAELERLPGQSVQQEPPRERHVSNKEENYDVFVSHAFEDKQAFVAPLVDRLRQAGLRVWYDDLTLKLGDSLRAKIDQGLRESRYGVVVLSQAFFTKSWTQRELNGLFALTRDEPRILPVWHDVTADELKNYSPMLADIKAVRSSDGLDAVAKAIVDAVSASK